MLKNQEKIQTAELSSRTDLIEQSKISNYYNDLGQVVWCMPLIPLRRQRQADFCEFEARLIYRESFRTARVVTHALKIQ